VQRGDDFVFVFGYFEVEVEVDLVEWWGGERVERFG